LAGSADASVADAALALMAAESRRRGLIDSNRLERTELPAELHHRLVWWVAAAIREQLGPSAADRMIVEAALRALADHDEGDRLESAAMRLAAAIDPQPAELATVLKHALGDRRLALVIALLGHALGVDYATMRHIVLDGGEQLWLTLRGTDLDRATVARIVQDATGVEPEALRFLDTDEGLVAYLTVRLGPGTALADAHAQASRIEEAIRRERPEIADVVVHTEPSA